MSSSGAEAGLLDGFEDEVDGFGVGFEGWGEAALVADGGVVALLLEDGLEGVEDLGAPAEGVREGFGADGHDHELLEVDVVIGVGAAVEDVHHGGGEGAGVDAAEVAIEGEGEGGGGGAGGGHGDGEDGVGAEGGLVGGVIEGDHGGVDESLVGGVEAGEFGAEDGLDVVDGFEDAFAEEVGLVVVAEFDGLVLAGGGAGGDGGAAAGAGLEGDVGLDGGVTAGVEDFAGGDGGDFGVHAVPFLGGCLRGVGDDAVGEAVVEAGAVVDGSGDTIDGEDGLDERISGGVAHVVDFSKARGWWELRAW